MLVLERIAGGCRRDPHYAMAVAGIGFWVLFGAALFTLDGLGILPRY